ncbi:hypothetical protein L204_103609 [Cryptococcus depauperatus]
MGDAGFTCTPHIISMYRRLRNEPQLVGRPAFFSHRVKLARVCRACCVSLDSSCEASEPSPKPPPKSAQANDF